MKTLRSLNKYYLWGTVPFIFAISWMSAGLLKRGWQKGLSLAAGIIIIVFLFRKFFVVPRPEKDYGDMLPCDLYVPETFGTVIFLCPSMDKYDFLKRNIEIISPLFNGRKPLKVAVSPAFRKKAGDDIMSIALMRELIRYRKAVQVITILGLATPILAVACIVEGYFYFRFNLIYPIASGITNFIGPVILMGSLVVLFLSWNKMVSLLDYKTDDELRKYYPDDKIADYIEKWDELLLPEDSETTDSKSRELELHYIKERSDRFRK